MNITCICFQITALLMLIYAGMLMALMSVCLPGQARWGGEEEQGDEGGGLSVDEGGGRSQKNVSFFAVKKRKEKKRTQKQLGKRKGKMWVFTYDRCVGFEPEFSLLKHTDVSFFLK